MGGGLPDADGVHADSTRSSRSQGNYLTVYPANLTAPPMVADVNWTAGGPYDVVANQVLRNPRLQLTEPNIPDLQARLATKRHSSHTEHHR